MSPSVNITNTDTKAIYSHIYLNLYQSVGDTNKKNGLETECLLDTGASSSIINYNTYLEFCKTQHLYLKIQELILLQ